MVELNNCSIFGPCQTFKMQQGVLITFLILGIWLLGISLVLYKIYAVFAKLTRGVEVADLKKTLERVIVLEGENEKGIETLTKRINGLEEDGKLHVQKVGLVRFNPFNELGGDHSFSLALLDSEDTGIIITGLHTRERTRIYVKSLKRGKSESELSTEDKKALAIAQKNK